MKRRKLLWLILLIPAVVASYGIFSLARDFGSPRSRSFVLWFTGNEATRQTLLTTRRDACPGAPFVLPSDGFIGLLYGDPRGPYSSQRPHQGIDIFSPEEPGVTPVYAAYDGYIRREPGWKSSLIQRVPSDPLQPDRQIWLYYTHMANQDGTDFIVDAFPPGTREIFVEQGTLLGYTGDYNGSSARPVSTHLHFSIVLDDGAGSYTNELQFENTVDPSPYLGMALHYQCDASTGNCGEGPGCG
ncbi:MAG: M23 family metallopeptidase [Candidatus Promineifilaceae bacterium]|nr:M23 family metallopeptidase [Candidatus Promineifilaceae bacterium]